MNEKGLWLDGQGESILDSARYVPGSRQGPKSVSKVGSLPSCRAGEASPLIINSLDSGFLLRWAEGQKCGVDCDVQRYERQLRRLSFSRR